MWFGELLVRATSLSNYGIELERPFQLEIGGFHLDYRGQGPGADDEVKNFTPEG